MRDAVAARAVEHRQAVVDQQRAHRIEGLDLLQALPEFLLLLGRAQRMRTDYRIEARAESRARHFQRHALVMRIGRQHHAAAAGAHRIEKGRDVRMDVDQVRDFFLEAHDVQLQLGLPEIHRIPVEGAGAGVKARHQFLASAARRQAARRGIALRQMHLPEMVVEIQVEQGAVHVEQDAVDARPVEQRALPRVRGGDRHDRASADA